MFITKVKSVDTIRGRVSSEKKKIVTRKFRIDREKFQRKSCEDLSKKTKF